MADVTHLLSAIDSGDPLAAEQLLPLVYDESARRKHSLKRVVAVKALAPRLAASPAARRRFVREAQPVRCVAYSPDGKRLASGGEDRTVRLHDLAGGSPRTFAAPAAVNGVTFSPDGRYLTTANANGTLHVLRVGSGAGP